MAYMAALESDLRALSAEARRRYPAVKDAAEHAILKLRSFSGPREIAHNEDMVRIFLMACDVRSVKLSVIGLSCLQKLISHDAVAPSALKDILSTLKDHAEMADDSVQLKTLQALLLIFQSHLLPDNEGDMALALGICLRLLENNRSSDSVRNTAAATFRQAVALIFDNVVHAESLSSGKCGISRANTITNDVTRSVSSSFSLETRSISVQPIMKGSLSNTGKLGLLLLEDLTALAAGGSAIWLRVHSLQRIFALDILEFVLSHYVTVFQTLVSYEQVLRHQICSLLMTSLRTNLELEGEFGEPTFRRLVLRSVAHIIRLYSTSLVTESEVFLNMLVKVTRLDLPLWHRILVLEVLRGFCLEAQTLRSLFQNFDMEPKNTNIVENIVKALARVVSTIQLVPDSSEESLAAVAGMFSSKAKGIEWSMDNDASNAAVVVASEAHAITLAVEGILGVVFAVATLTDEAVDVGELESPKNDADMPLKFSGETAVLCTYMVNSTWLTILDSLSLILARSQGEAVIIEILKGYQAFTQACGVLHVIEPLNSFLASLCKFTIYIPTDLEKRSVLHSPGSKKSEPLIDQRDNVVLTPKNVQALRTLFNVAHRLHNVLGASWVLVLETLAALDRAIHSPHASTQEVSSSVSRLTRETSGQYSDFNILSSLNSQLFESSALMHVSAVKSLLSALHQLSSQCISGYPSGTGQALNQQIGSVAFCVGRIISVLVNNLHRVQHIWDDVVGHLLQLSENSNQQLRNLALDALDQSICAVLGSDQLQNANNIAGQVRPFEYAVLSPLTNLYSSSEIPDVHAGVLKILLHVLERHAEKLHFSWSNILDMLRSIADASDRDLISLGFQNIRVIMNDGLSTMPVQCLDVCIEVTGAYGAQKTEINISLTAIGLLWTATDFIAKGLFQKNYENENDTTSEVDNIKPHIDGFGTLGNGQFVSNSDSFHDPRHLSNGVDHNKLLFSVFSILQNLGSDERPEVRNSAIRTLFQTLGSHGQKISTGMWEYCLWTYVFPLLEHVSHLAATSSSDEWQGKELGIRGGKTVHMLIHHSRNTAQKQWDETVVLVLGGITRLLRSFFPFLQSLNNFSAGWKILLRFIEDSIFNGSKEVAIAAINCLQTVVTSHCPKEMSLHDHTYRRRQTPAGQADQAPPTDSNTSQREDGEPSRPVTERMLEHLLTLMTRQEERRERAEMAPPVIHVQAPAQQGSVFAEFQRMRPPTYDGTTDAHGLEEWIRVMEKGFRAIRCRDEDMVLLATYQLRGPADLWWNQEEQLMAGRYINWLQFKEKLTNKFLPEVVQEKLRDQFLHLKQHSLSVTDYEREFTRLARYAPAYVATERERLLRFRKGLKLQLRTYVMAYGATTYAQTVNAALEVEEAEGERALVSEARKRKDSHYHGNQNKKQQTHSQQQQTGQQQKGKLTLPYIKSMLNVYKLALERSTDWRTNSAVKVKQEILHGLGDMYVQAQSMFDTDMYLELLGTIHLVVKISKIQNDLDTEIGILPPLQRTILEVLPLLRPSNHISSAWSLLLQELLFYLLASDVPIARTKDEPNTSINSGQASVTIGPFTLASITKNETTKENQIKSSSDDLECSACTSIKAVELPSLLSNEASSFDTAICSWNHLFMEKLIPVIVELFLEAPPSEKYSIFPEIMKGIGRCMNTRRDNPKSSLWRLAVEGFNRILINGLMVVDNNIKLDTHLYRNARSRLWKEIADVYDIFLLGSCGRALSSDGTTETLKSDEVIEMTVLNVLSDTILKGQIDAPVEILQRLVSTLDRCVSRTGCLPIDSLELMPSHCSRFSLGCLQMMFSLCSFSLKDDWPPARIAVSTVSIDILIKRCEIIMKQFLIDENDLGERPLPTFRINETIFVLQELSHMLIHSETVAVLNLPAHLKETIETCETHAYHTHLLVLFPSLCDLVVSRETRIRELVQVLLRIVAKVLGLQKTTVTQ